MSQSRNIKNSAMARAAKVLKLMIDNPHVYRISTLTDEIDMDHDTVRGIISALRGAGWEVVCDGRPDYTYHVKGYTRRHTEPL